MSEFAATLFSRRRLQVAGSLLSVAAVATACGSDDGSEVPVAHSSVTVTASESAQATNSTTTAEAGQRHSKYQIIFDYLNSGSKIIDVYPSPINTTKNGTFEDGQTAPAYCKEQGRTVQSQPGETPARRSDEWIKVMTNSTGNNTEYFATAVYIQDPDKILAELPDC